MVYSSEGHRSVQTVVKSTFFPKRCRFATDGFTCDTWRGCEVRGDGFGDAVEIADEDEVDEGGGDCDEEEVGEDEVIEEGAFTRFAGVFGCRGGGEEGKTVVGGGEGHRRLGLDLGGELGPVSVG